MKHHGTVFLIGILAGWLPASLGVAAPLFAHNAGDVCGPTADPCQISKKYTVTGTGGTFDFGDRAVDVLPMGALLGDASVAITIKARTVTLEKGAVISNNGKGFDAGPITVDTSASTTPGGCTIAGKLQANSTTVSSVSGSGGAVLVDCAGIDFGATGLIEAKGPTSSGGTVTVNAHNAPLTAPKGAKIVAQGNDGGSISLTGGDCAPLDAAIYADARPVTGIVGLGGQVTVACTGNIVLPKDAKIVGSSVQGGDVGKVQITAMGQCAGDNTGCTDDSACLLGVCGQFCHTNLSPCSDSTDCPTEVCQAGFCTTSTGVSCTTDADCPNETCDGAPGQCSGNGKSCSLDDDCFACDAVQHCSVTQTQTCNGRSPCPLGESCLAQHCSATVATTCALDSDCPTGETCLVQVQMAKGALIQNNGAAASFDDNVIAVSTPGACNISGKVTSDFKPDLNNIPASTAPGTIDFECAGGFALGSKAIVESTNRGDAAGNVNISNINGPCDLAGAINVKASAIVDLENGTFSGIGGVVSGICSRFSIGGSIDASGTGGDGFTDSLGGYIAISADPGAANITGKVVAKGKGEGGEIDLEAIGITTGPKSTIDASGNLPSSNLQSGASVTLLSRAFDTTVTGSVDIGGSVVAKGVGLSNAGGLVAIEACNVTTELKSKISTDGISGGSNALTAHKTLVVNGPVSALAAGTNDFAYGSTKTITGKITPPSSPMSQTFSGDNCP